MRVAAPRSDRRVAYVERPGVLMVTRGHNAAHGSLEEMERFARDILRAVEVQRLAQYTADVWIGAGLSGEGRLFPLFDA